MNENNDLKLPWFHILIELTVCHLSKLTLTTKINNKTFFICEFGKCKDSDFPRWEIFTKGIMDNKRKIKGNEKRGNWLIIYLY